MKSPAGQSGQALLIVLLSMAVVLTIVLSAISFSVTDIAVTSRESEALRAFSAAEAGVEKSLVALSPQSGSFGADNYSANVSGVAQGSQTFNYPADIPSGDVATVWFMSHGAEQSYKGTRMVVCWGSATTLSNLATTPAIETSVYYLSPPSGGGDFSGATVARDTADPNVARVGQNAFSGSELGGCTIDGKVYAFKKTIDFAALGIPAGSYNSANGLLLAHVKLYYNSDVSQPVGFDVTTGGAGQLPSQGEKIDSTGTAGESTRKVEVYRLYPDIAAVFESAVFSPSSIIK